MCSHSVVLKVRVGMRKILTGNVDESLTKPVGYFVLTCTQASRLLMLSVSWFVSQLSLFTCF